MGHSRRDFFRKMGKAAGVTAAAVVVPAEVFKAVAKEPVMPAHEGEGLEVITYVSAMVAEPAERIQGTVYPAGTLRGSDEFARRVSPFDKYPKGDL